LFLAREVSGPVCGWAGYRQESVVGGVSLRQPCFTRKARTHTFVAPSVFNHYNRVHANLQSQPDSRYAEWNDQGERTYRSPSMRLSLVSTPCTRNGPGNNDCAGAAIPSARQGSTLPIYIRSWVATVREEQRTGNVCHKPLVVTRASRHLISSKRPYRLR